MICEQANGEPVPEVKTRAKESRNSEHEQQGGRSEAEVNHVGNSSVPFVGQEVSSSPHRALIPATNVVVLGPGRTPAPRARSSARAQGYEGGAHGPRRRQGATQDRRSM